MPNLSVTDGTEIYFKDTGGDGQTILFSHGWPLTSDMWDNQLMVFPQHGFRVVAYDRRGFGRSSKAYTGNTNEHFGDDIAALIEHLDLHNVVLVGHSMAGGDISRYVSRHGTARLAKIVLLSAVTPLLLQSETNPDGAPQDLFDGMRKNVAENRAEFFTDLPRKFFGYNRLTHRTSEPMIHWFWLQAMMAGVKPTYDCIEQFSAVDFTADLTKFDVPTLLIHGDDDQIVPIAISALKAVEIIPGAKLKIYSGGSHAISLINQADFNADLLDFIKS